jgi:hypothetical protein
MRDRIMIHRAAVSRLAGAISSTLNGGGYVAAEAEGFKRAENLFARVDARKNATVRLANVPSLGGRNFRY